MKIFKPLNQVNSEYGGKAFGLKKLIDAGLNVPNGVAISANNLLKFIQDSNTKNIKEILQHFNKSDVFAVRSSALNEDGSEQSFAGQYKSVLNVSNTIEALTEAIRTVYESSLSKEIQKYSGNNQDLMGVVIQKMIDPKYAGVMFTEATDLNGDRCCLIEIVEGLGEQLVSGHANTTRIIIPYQDKFSLDIKNSRTEGDIKDPTIINNLLDSINKINNFFQQGMDIEWCIDNKGLASIVQARPITKHILIPEISKTSGIIASIGNCKGKTFVIDSDLDDEELIPLINSFPEGSILIAPFTDTQYMPAINKAVGIITEEGSILSHAAIISREKGIPCVVAFKDASTLFPTGTEVSLNTASGEIISKNYSSKCEDRDIDWESIYVFENLEEDVTIDDCRVLVESSSFDKKDIVVHTPYEVTSSQYNNIEYYIRKKYHKPANFIASEKYLWFDEYDRFTNYEIFNKYLKLSKVVCKEQNVVKLKQIYKLILNDAKHLVKLKQTIKNPTTTFELEEMMASLHLIADSIIPDGYGLLSVYNKISTFENVSFKDFLNGNFDKNNEELVQCFNFFKTISDFRNTICQIFVDMGAYSFDYFDDRDERALAAIGLKRCKEPVSKFYSNIKKKQNITHEENKSIDNFIIDIL